MLVKCTLVLLTFLRLTAGWISEVASPEGLLLGDGLTLRLLDSQTNTTDFMERQAVRMEYGDYGVSMRKKGTAVEMGLIEGRGNKRQPMMTIILGYKLATIATMIFTGLGALVFKAFALAKLAIVSSLILLIVKLFHHHKEPEYYELDHHPEAQNFVEQYMPASDGNPSASANSYYAYANYNPTGMSNANYAVDPSVGNSSAVAQSHQTGGTIINAAALKRQDLNKRNKSKLPPLLTIHRYTVNT